MEERSRRQPLCETSSAVDRGCFTQSSSPILLSVPPAAQPFSEAASAPLWVESGVGLSTERAAQRHKHLPSQATRARERLPWFLTGQGNCTRLLLQRPAHGRLEGNSVRERLFRPAFLARF